MPQFNLQAPFQPTGDQPEAIEALVKGFREGNQFQTLLARRPSEDVQIYLHHPSAPAGYLTGGYGFRRDLHDGKRHSGIAEAPAGDRP